MISKNFSFSSCNYGNVINFFEVITFSKLKLLTNQAKKKKPESEGQILIISSNIILLLLEMLGESKLNNVRFLEK